MAFEIIMPRLGLTMTEGTVVKWLKPEGATVQKGEPLLEVMTDKATLEVESPESGILGKIIAREGAVVPVAGVIGFLVSDIKEIEGLKFQGAAVTATGLDAASSQSDELAKLAVSVSSSIGEGGKIKASPAARRVARESGANLAEVTPSRADGRIIARDVQAFVAERRAVKATPLARKLAADQGVDLGSVAPLVPGRIYSADVLAARSEKGAAGQTALGTGAPASAAPLSFLGVPGTDLPVTGMRKTIAERMALSAHSVAAVTLTTEVDMTGAVDVRTQLLPVIEKKAGVRISYNDIIVKAVASALRDHPDVNAHWLGDRIHLAAQINVGMAVALQAGLIVPVIKAADRKSLSEIAVEAKGLAERARQGKLVPEEFSGGTFTVTNLGGYDIDVFSPIINPPEVAILGAGRIVEKPIARNGQVLIAPMMFLSLTFDHRAIDGAPAAAFLKQVKATLENPVLLLA
ncbi:MAG: 2-oxo acid dehydrogenase subunit E2 [Actinobacteria bacterium]|nr:2-oxo acid dehydrogenase subunit E2 [Actinomycetota bacterium]